MISDEKDSLKSIPIGIIKDSLNTYNYNFKYNPATLISSNEIENCNDVIENLLKAFRNVHNIVSVLFDFENALEELKPIANSYCSKDYDDFIDSIAEYYNNKIKNNNYDLVLLIYGIDKFKNNVSIDKINLLTNLAKKNDSCRIIFIDNAFNFKQFTFESWYSGIVASTNGIWIGADVQTQAVIKSNEFGKKYNQKINDEFAWVFKNGNGCLVKLINERRKDNV